MAIIKIDNVTQYNTDRLCGPPKTKNKAAYSVAELRAIAKSLSIKPIPKTSIELCQKIKERVKAQFGVDIIVTVQDGAPAAAAAAKKPSVAKKPKPPSEKPAAKPIGVKFDPSVDCSKKGKDSLYTLAELKAIAKQLGISIAKLNKEPLCEEIKKKLAGAPAAPKKTPIAPAPKKTPIAPAPKKTPVAAATSPLGYIPNSDYVKIKPGVTFNMNVDCKAKKTLSNPNNYSKKDLQVYAQALGIKLKKNNLESCLAIKEKIRELYKKPSPLKSGLPLEPTPTPPAPLSEKDLMDAIRKCLNLKN
jgi:hypothetical protein